jgi:hypothetical protein
VAGIGGKVKYPKKTDIYVTSQVTRHASAIQYDDIALTLPRPILLRTPNNLHIGFQIKAMPRIRVTRMPGLISRHDSHV